MADGTLIFDTKLDSSGLDSGLSKVASTTQSALGGVAAVGSAALAAGTTAAVALTKTVVSAYADYEQLTGGVETLFKDSSKTVMDYAFNAEQTAGISANDYMEQITSFSASLLQGLNGDTAAAADIANRAIIDMSDNANKMGTDISSLQNAYQGFAKGNFTMLDNLKLGYGGTKEEMERLIEDASKMTTEMDALGVSVDADSMSFDNIINAISVMQEHLGIAGTTSKEASTTISGSLQAVKASWDNMLIAMSQGDSWDMNAWVNGFIDKVGTLFDNLMPVVETSLEGIALLVEELAPQIADRLPGLVDNVLPALLSAATSLINGLVNALPSLLQVLLAQLPTIIQSICDTLIANLPMVINVGLQIIVELANGIAQSLPTLIPTMVDVVLKIVETLINNIDQLVDAGIQLIIGLATGLIDAIPKIVEKVPTIISKLVTALVNNAPKLLESGVKLMVALAKGLIQAIPQILKSIPQIITGMLGAFQNAWPKLKEAGVNLIKGLGEGIVNAKDWLVNKVRELCNNALDAIKGFFGIASPSKKFKWIGEMCVEGMGEGFDGMDDVTRGVNASLGNIKANISGGDVRTATNNGLADALAVVLQNMGVYMDGRAVGYVTAEYVDAALGRFAVRRV